GVGVVPWLGAWLVVVLLLLVRRRWLRWSARLAGWLLLVPIAATLADQWRDHLALAGGGSIGVFLAGWLAEALRAPWARAAPLAVGAAAVLLAFDWLWLRLVPALWWLARAEVIGWHRLLRALAIGLWSVLVGASLFRLWSRWRARVAARPTPV